MKSRIVLIAGLMGMASWGAEPANPTSMAVKRYREIVAKLAENRPSLGNEANEFKTATPPKKFERREGEFYVHVEERTHKLAKELKELVFHDNTGGFVYPGSLLWTHPLVEGRFVAIPKIEGRAPVATTIEDCLIPGAKPTFRHDGSYFDFKSNADDLLKKIDRTAPRIALEIGYGKTIGSALLDIGISAKVWGSSLDASLTRTKNEQRTFAVISLAQVYYTIVADTPPPAGYFSEEYLNDPALARIVLGKINEYGEIGYVRSVKYGRRVIIAVSASSTTKQLKRSLSLSAGGLGFAFKGKVTDDIKNIWETMEAKAVVIGGKSSEKLADVVTGGTKDFLANVNTFLKETAKFDEKTVPVPVSFEVRYAHDNEPMINYETLEFAGQIVTRKSRAEEKKPLSVPVELTASDARLVHEDAEIHTDDWTKVSVGYSLTVSGDKRGIDAKITMNAYECEDDKRYDGQTHIRTERTIRVFELDRSDKRTIRAVSTKEALRSKEELFGGELHNSFGFPNVGALRDITVRVDHNGGDDRTVQELKAKLSFEVDIDREK